MFLWSSVTTHWELAPTFPVNETPETLSAIPSPTVNAKGPPVITPPSGPVGLVSIVLITSILLDRS